MARIIRVRKWRFGYREQMASRGCSRYPPASFAHLVTRSIAG